MGLQVTCIQFCPVHMIKETTENTSVCCVCFRKQTVRFHKTVKSY